MDLLYHINGTIPVLCDDAAERGLSLPHSITVNVRTCYLCAAPAKHVYYTTAFTWRGRAWPSEKRDLCDLHMRKACGSLVESVEVRVQVERQYERDEKGRVA